MDKERIVNCTSHCSACGQHFHSTSAFVQHRRGKYMPKPGERGRYCVHAEDAAKADGSDLFEAMTEDGICKLNGSVQSGVIIWTLAGSQERAQVFAKLRAQQRKPKPKS